MVLCVNRSRKSMPRAIRQISWAQNCARDISRAAASIARPEVRRGSRQAERSVTAAPQHQVPVAVFEQIHRVAGFRLDQYRDVGGISQMIGDDLEIWVRRRLCHGPARVSSYLEGSPARFGPVRSTARVDGGRDRVGEISGWSNDGSIFLPSRAGHCHSSTEIRRRPVRLTNGMAHFEQAGVVGQQRYASLRTRYGTATIRLFLPTLA